MQIMAGGADWVPPVWAVRFSFLETMPSKGGFLEGRRYSTRSYAVLMP